MEPFSHPVIGLQMFAWSQVLPVGWLLLLVFVVLAVGPLVFAWRRGDPLSLAMVLSLLLCWGMQTILSHFEGTWYFLVEVFASTRPGRRTRRIFTACSPRVGFTRPPPVEGSPGSTSWAMSS